MRCGWWVVVWWACLLGSVRVKRVRVLGVVCGGLGVVARRPCCLIDEWWVVFGSSGVVVVDLIVVVVVAEFVFFSIFFDFRHACVATCRKSRL